MRELRRSFALTLREEENRTRRQQMFAYTRKVGGCHSTERGLHLDICSLCHLSFSSCWLGESTQHSQPRGLPYISNSLCVPNLSLYWLSVRGSKPCSKHFVIKFKQNWNQNQTNITLLMWNPLPGSFSFLGKPRFTPFYFPLISSLQHTTEPLVCQLNMKMQIRIKEKGNKCHLNPIPSATNGNIENERSNCVFYQVFEDTVTVL